VRYFSGIGYLSVNDDDHIEKFWKGAKTNSCSSTPAGMVMLLNVATAGDTGVFTS